MLRLSAAGTDAILHRDESKRSSTSTWTAQNRCTTFDAVLNTQTTVRICIDAPCEPVAHRTDRTFPKLIK